MRSRNILERRFSVVCSLVFVIFLMVLTGVFLILSTSIPISNEWFGEPFYFFKRQLFFTMVGGIGMFVVYTIPIVWLKNYGRILFLIVLMALVVLLIPSIGVEVKGSVRWLSFGGIRIQPSEFMKPIFVIFMAALITKMQPLTRASFKHVIKLFLILALCGILLLSQPDYGTFFILSVLLMLLLWLSNLPLRWFISIGFSLGAVLSLLIISSSYRLNRVLSFWNPWDDFLGADYQIANALIAFNRGGWFGVGAGESVQKMFYIPDVHTDFLFAVIGEEFGFFGCLFVLVLYIFLWFLSIKVARVALLRGDYFSYLTAYGLGFWILLQALINMLVNTGLLPTKGLTLPLMSYGGSSLLSCLISLAIIIRIEVENRRFFHLK